MDISGEPTLPLPITVTLEKVRALEDSDSIAEREKIFIFTTAARQILGLTMGKAADHDNNSQF